MPEYVAKEKKTFRERIFEHQDRIMEISTKEFTGGYWETKVIGNYTEKVYHPDQRKCYIQSVESWTSLLFPFFNLDEKMIKDFETIEKEIELNLKNYENKKIKQDRYTILKLRIMQRLFRRLNVFLFNAGITRIKTSKKFG